MVDIKSFASKISPEIKTRNLAEIEDKTGNLYKSLAIISIRANQVNDTLRIELKEKLPDFTTQLDPLEESADIEERTEIARQYEKLPHPTIIATEEFIQDKIYYRMRDEEGDSI